MRNLAHFENKRTLFNMNNTIFSLTSGEGSCYMLHATNQSRETEPVGPLILTSL